jgi:hypothetical protein
MYRCFDEVNRKVFKDLPNLVRIMLRAEHVEVIARNERHRPNVQCCMNSRRSYCNVHCTAVVERVVKSMIKGVGE